MYAEQWQGYRDWLGYKRWRLFDEDASDEGSVEQEDCENSKPGVQGTKGDSETRGQWTDVNADNEDDLEEVEYSAESLSSDEGDKYLQKPGLRQQHQRWLSYSQARGYVSQLGLTTARDYLRWQRIPGMSYSASLR